MNIILGGGLVALLARDILGPKWKLIPIGKSQYFSWQPALADNYIIKDDTIDEYMSEYAFIPMVHRIAYSYGGQLIFNPAVALEHYLNKLYSPYIPPHASAYWSKRGDIIGYGDCVDIYRRLQLKYKDEILNNNNEYGSLVRIKDQVITTSSGKHIEYDELISTIPLPSLLANIGVTAIDIPSKDMYCYHIQTGSLDLEGATHVFVADPEIDFYKVTQLNKVNYLFYSTKQIVRPGAYFINFMNKFELIAETMIPKAIPCGQIPELINIKENKIMLLGRSAVWDDCLDVGSCIKRLVKIANNKS